MPILNAYTKVEAVKTASEILTLLGKLGAKQASITYGPDQEPIALDFVLGTAHGDDMRFTLPARVGGVHAALETDWVNGRLEARYATEKHARRVAWRILKDWMEAQVALIQSGMVRAEEVLLPYHVLPGGDVTFFEAYVDNQKKLGPGAKP